MKNVLITGGSRGIGSAIAKAFAAEGCNIALSYFRQENKAKKNAEELSAKFGVRAIAVRTDVSDSSSVKEMFDYIEDELGEIDTLINNAGIAGQKLFTDITDEDWRAMLGVNLNGVFYCSREALKRYMLPKHGGVIMNISSMWGQTGASCEVHYSASKAGVIGLTKALAKEVGLSGVRVNCICPGVIMTDMMKGFDSDSIETLKADTPLNALGTPEDIAQAVLFYCSDKAKFITGQIIGVNGGFVI